MSFLVRKIARGKWPDNDYPLVNIPEDIPAKFSLDLRSNDDNSLSFWYIDSENEDDLKEAVLALATGPQVDSVDNIDIVWLDREQLEKKLKEKGAEIDDNSPGFTSIDALVATHRNARKITYSSLGVIAEMVVKAIRNDKRRKFTEKKVRTYLKEALSAGRINKDKCNPDLLSKLEKSS